ncbi:MAG: hypothetical protein U0936_22790 [Planctomycetaceae bacterium]
MTSWTQSVDIYSTAGIIFRRCFFVDDLVVVPLQTAWWSRFDDIDATEAVWFIDATQLA